MDAVKTRAKKNKYSSKQISDQHDLPKGHSKKRKQPTTDEPESKMKKLNKTANDKPTKTKKQAMTRGYVERTDKSSNQPGTSRSSASLSTRPSSGPTYVVLDLETTGLIDGTNFPHITQIACIQCNTDKQFSTYVIPKKPLSINAKRLTSIDCHGSDVTYRGQRVNASPIREALESLCNWLSDFSKVTLIAHNGEKFDFPVLISAVQQCGMEKHFTDRVRKFADSLIIMRFKVPGLVSYTQKNLAQRYDISISNAHNALGDVCTLDKILTAASVTDQDIRSNSYRADFKF